MDVPTNPPPVNTLLAHTFREEFGRMVAILAGKFGIEHLHSIEDAVQDALLKAMTSWPLSGVPDHPSAWLLHAARNQLLDQFRRQARWRGKRTSFTPLVEETLTLSLAAGDARFEDEIRDGQLRMIFVCCHPSLTSKAQISLALKTLCGFSEGEIATAFMENEAAVTKRLVRARQCLRDQPIGLEIPPNAKLTSRLSAVLHALYLLFNEGYKASQGETLVRAELCDEAIRLTEILLQHPAGNHPETHALLALMHFSAARSGARLGIAGELITLAEQDRSRWDKGRIAAGFHHLDHAARGAEVTRFHLEAGIAACHVAAPDFGAVDWSRILSLYDQLAKLDDSPVILLNRAVALARVNGFRAGLDVVERLNKQRALKNYYLLHAVAGRLWLEAGEIRKAATAFERARGLARIPAEQAFLERRLALCAK